VLDEDIELAAKVHYSFLPDSYGNEFLEIAVKAIPYDRIGGDYCSVLPVSDDKLVVCMCDTVGHGTASALFASRVNTYTLTHALRQHDPCKLICSLNEFLCQRLAGTWMYTTFCTVLFDMKTRAMECAGAAHPPVLHYRHESGEVELLPSKTSFLGMQTPLIKKCVSYRRELASGDRVIIYTDGLTEARKGDGSFFGTEGLVRFTKRQPTLGTTEFNAALFEEIFSGGGQVTDDILAMTITIK
jgi:serine phosphatase RsbU (regulator of sigma subunit)